MLVFAEFVEFVAVSTCDLDGEPLRLVSPLVEGGGGGGGGPMAPLGGAFGAAVIVVSCNGNVKAVVSASACCLFHAEMASMLLIPIFGGAELVVSLVASGGFFVAVVGFGFLVWSLAFLFCCLGGIASSGDLLVVVQSLEIRGTDESVVFVCLLVRSAAGWAAFARLRDSLVTRRSGVDVVKK